MECAKELGVQIVGVKWVTSLSSAGWADTCMMYLRCKIEFFFPVTLFYRVLKKSTKPPRQTIPYQFRIMSFCLQAQTSMKQSNYCRHQNNMKWRIINPSITVKTEVWKPSLLSGYTPELLWWLDLYFSSNKHRNRSASTAWYRLDSLNKINRGSDFVRIKVVCYSLIISRQNTQASFWLAGGRNES